MFEQMIQTDISNLAWRHVLDTTRVISNGTKAKVCPQHREISYADLIS